MSTHEHRCRILGGALGNCVHVAGVFEYLRIAEQLGCDTCFLGAAVAPDLFARAILEFDPDVICVSYRLNPSSLDTLLERLFVVLDSMPEGRARRYYFGGTPECIAVARRFNRFEVYFQGEERPEKILESIPGIAPRQKLMRHSLAGSVGPGTRRDLLEQSFTPMIRHHFGLPSLEETIDGVACIAESEQVDVISLAPDQNAQEFFFEPWRMDPMLDGGGGVPLRSEDDLRAIWSAAQTGNFPRLKIYAGTNNLLKWAELSVRVLHVPWGTVPLFWYSLLDGRSRRPLENAIRENSDVIRWYAQQGIPVEINDAHQWSLRECSDVMAVTDSYIAAYNAKRLGASTYIAQFMFNTPRLTTGRMDLAKMLASIELMSELEDDGFTVLRQIRAGLTHFSVDMDVAKGQLAASTLLGLAIRPHIVHVVGFCEADHPARPEDVIESCKIVRGVLKNGLRHFPDMTQDEDVQARKNHLIEQARVFLSTIRQVYSEFEDPLCDSRCLSSLVTSGFLDAPHLQGNSCALGRVKTMPIRGAYESVDARGAVISENERLKMLLDH